MDAFIFTVLDCMIQLKNSCMSWCSVGEEWMNWIGQTLKISQSSQGLLLCTLREFCFGLCVDYVLSFQTYFGLCKGSVEQIHDVTMAIFCNYHLDNVPSQALRFLRFFSRRSFVCYTSSSRTRISCNCPCNLADCFYEILYNRLPCHCTLVGTWWTTQGHQVTRLSLYATVKCLPLSPQWT